MNISMNNAIMKYFNRNSRSHCCLLKVQYISLTKLQKLVDTDQLPEELGGSLPYQHKQWVKNRIVSYFLV